MIQDNVHSRQLMYLHSCEYLARLTVGKEGHNHWKENKSLLGNVDLSKG